MVKIQGGTHLGIKGCYAEKDFADNISTEQIKEILMRQFKSGELSSNLMIMFREPIGEVSWSSYTSGKRTVYTIIDERGFTVFEWCFV